MSGLGIAHTGAARVIAALREAAAPVAPEDQGELEVTEIVETAVETAKPSETPPKTIALEELEDDRLLSRSEVAAEFGVRPPTVTRWAKKGKLSPFRTLGGHRRYRASEIKQLLEEHTGD